MNDFTVYALFFFAGIGSLAILVRWAALSSRRASTPVSDYLERGGDLAVPPDPAIGHRIFSQSDWVFVCESLPANARRRFLTERKALAHEWLDRSAAHVSYVMKAHRVAAGKSADTSASREFRVAARYAFYMLRYELLSFAVWWRGPFFAADFFAEFSQRLQQFDRATGVASGGTRSVKLSPAGSRS